MWAGDPEEGERATQALREVAMPIVDMSGRVDYLEFEGALDAFFPAGRQRYWKALYLDGLSDAAVDAMVEWSNRRPSNDTAVVGRRCWRGDVASPPTGPRSATAARSGC